MSRRREPARPGARGRLKCPICGAPAPPRDADPHPFCSQRCKWTDLGRWASGRYLIPGEKAEGEGDGQDPDPEAE